MSHGILKLLISWKARKVRFTSNFKNDDDKYTITKHSPVGSCNWIPRKWKNYLRTVTCSNSRWGIWQNIELYTCKHDPKKPPQYEQQWKSCSPLRKERILTFSCIYDPLYGRETYHIVTNEQEGTKIVPQKDEVEDITLFFFNAFKVTGARKLYPRIRWHYSGISIKRIQK